MRPILVSASYEHDIRIWDVDTGHCRETITHKESQVNALSISPDGAQLVAVGWQHIRIYDLATAAVATQVLTYEGVNKNVVAVGYQADGRWMYTGGEDGTARIWDMRMRQLHCQRIFQADVAVTSVCLHPNQVEMVVADSMASLYLWDLRKDSNDIIPITLEHLEHILHVDIDSQGKQMAAVTNKGRIIMWNIETYSAPDRGDASRLIQLSHLPAHSSYALKCRFAPDCSLLATTSADETVSLWNAGPLMPKYRTLKEPNMKWVWDCAWTADGKGLFTASSDYLLRFWNVATGQRVQLYQGHPKAITAMAFRDVVR